MRQSVTLAMVAALTWLGGVTPATALAEDTWTGPGDLNCDGVVDYSDIDPFVAALGCPGGSATCWTSPCRWLNADCNLDGAVSYDDIDAFVALIGTNYNGDVIQAQLAGNTLTEYPYFEYVAAFNENATIEMALDPTRYPAIVGTSVDVYVVATKTQAGWHQDPALVDLTADGPLTVMFSGSTIQENTFLVVGPDELSGGDGLDIGLGYDLVLDCNQDGVLNGGDYIDGLGGEAGLYVVYDLTQPGPYAVSSVTYEVGSVFGLPSGFGTELVYYPTDVASLGQLPLVTIAHGGGHLYSWFTYLQEHLASYGYIVMCHDTNNLAGIETSAVTVLGHTDAIIDLQDQIAGGVLNGHIDSHRIVWIGQARGGEGVVRAYDRVVDGEYTPTHFTADDIVLISSMVPTVFLGPTQSDPHDVPFVLWTAPGDSDVTGDPASSITQSPILYDRATGFRHMFSLQGVGHSGFHSGGGMSWFAGPCGVSSEIANTIVKAYHVPLLKYYTEGSVPAVDFFWRQHEHFRPAGIPTGDYCPVTDDDSVVVTKTYHNGADFGNFVIDDYQFGAAGVGYDDANVSGSGGTVTYTVEDLFEGRLDDGDAVYSWMSSDPMNGMIYASSSDDARGVVFGWADEDLYYEQGIVTEQRDFTPYRYLSFRACQATRHPYTTADLGDLTFSVTLRDGSGVSSSINIGAYGGGIEEPFQREGAGVGAGWFNEFETIRIRLTDYLTNASGLDLTDIVAVRFDVGPSWGSNEGRIGLDDIELTSDVPPHGTPVAVHRLSVPPAYVQPGSTTFLNVEILPGSEGLELDAHRERGERPTRVGHRQRALERVRDTDVANEGLLQCGRQSQ